MDKHLEFIQRVGNGLDTPPLVEFLNPNAENNRAYRKARDIRKRQVAGWISLMKGNNER